MTLLRHSPVRVAGTLAATVFVLATTTAAQGWVRPIDGRGTHPFRSSWGATGEPLLRLTFNDYEDGQSEPSGADRPSAREISNTVATQDRSMPSDVGATSMLWQWGQFLDHDISLTPGADPREEFPIPVPAGDPEFDPRGTGSVLIPLSRSLFEDDRRGRRQQLNEITAFIDGSMVYGSDAERARALRGRRGRLRMTRDGLLPSNTAGLANDPTSQDPSLFLAGDVRANEQTGLLVMHTLFVREHNRIADMINWLPLSDEFVYQFARALVTAQIQSITYDEFLPVLVGRRALRRYRGFRPFANPSIANEFSTAAYRLGHTLIPGDLLRVDASMQSGLPLALRDAFFNPGIVRAEGIDEFLRGLYVQPSQQLDPFVVDDLRSFLFGPPGSGGLDLASLNIQRGRDHGLPSYNAVRRRLGLGRARRWQDVTSDRALRRRLRAAYQEIDDIDLWVGGLAEDNVRGSMLGPVFHAIVVDQFERLRDGDPFHYKRSLPFVLRLWVDRRNLADVIRDNTSIGRELPDDVFRFRRG